MASRTWTLGSPEMVQGQTVDGEASLHYCVLCWWRDGGGGNKPRENLHQGGLCMKDSWTDTAKAVTKTTCFQPFSSFQSAVAYSLLKVATTAKRQGEDRAGLEEGYYRIGSLHIFFAKLYVHIRKATIFLPTLFQELE